LACLARNVPSLFIFDQVKFFLGIFLLSSSLALAKPIHLEHMVRVGGINQWIKLDGEDDKNPILLFLHGGPGNSVMDYSNKFTYDLKKHFIVVQWDQRESGKTKKLNRSTVPLTLELFEEDAVGIIQFLRERYQQEKIYLAGHSWGGFLTLLLASRHPELIESCYAAAPMVHQVESESMALVRMKEIATQESNQLALHELDQIKIPFENGEQIYSHRKWLYKLINRQKEPFTQEYVEEWADTWLNLFNKASEVNFFETAPEIKCPTYFLVGEKDYQTNCQLTKKYFEQLKAPKKELFWFTNSAHLLNLTESKKFQEVIISTLTQ
jgi:pimeloyl-ACP methyl ester carboxylesterase